MMKQHVWIRRVLLLVFLLVALVGCSANNTQKPSANAEPAPIEVEFQTKTWAPKVGDTLTFKLVVTQNGQPLDKPDDVYIELWKDKQRENHETVKPKKIGAGLYELTQTYKEPGTYYLMYHVEAGEVHEMSKRKVVVE
ncbi:FixH family protein [Aneurinibacillus uraniidurans]|uniref:FixH family protein n=1 Tax=Aneurinibacillus uraniidurans TaxID=2966586 RepID=UPI00234AA126|nr:FixH family protein [Aneurinibacillus sp. B1]WCN39315.1 FixH family protein [Aneurinibacillus sp. B1]